MLSPPRPVPKQAAQAGVDSAMAVLAQSFRDFPDSVTVWDPQQSQNSGTSSNGFTVNTPYNEGTSLYLRAVLDPSTGAANPYPLGVPAPGATPVPANDPGGNNPNNQACKNFVLPLISGVPNGRAQLARNKASILPAMNLSEPDPAKQNFVDLNSRRYGPNSASSIAAVRQYGDIWGVIGSPPDWTSPPSSSSAPVGPKPARALWVNLKDNNGLLTGRYAFWMEDESFRANVNVDNTGSLPPVGNADNATASSRIDNIPNSSQKYPVDPTTGQPSIVTPADAGLTDLLTAFEPPQSASADAQSALNARQAYPGKYLPDPLALLHTAGGSSGATALPTPTAEGLRYLTTTQSGTLNLTRHGTQRLNLNNAVQTVVPTNTTAIQKQINQIVAALKFHLPNFGQRFYRLSTGTDGTTLNNATTVASTATLTSEGVGDPSLIYLYKVAANIRDYVDTDSQPTLVGAGGTVVPAVAPNQPFGDDSQANPMWAVGKEAAPFLQETAIRFQPFVPQSAATGGKGTWKLAVDFYLEFWNMTDHDIYAVAQSDTTKASLNGARIRITNQQRWDAYPSGSPLINTNGGPNPQSPANDFTIDLSTGVNAFGNPVVFRAGSATVITTDPDYKNYTFTTPIHSSTKYTSLTGVSNPLTTFYCPIIAPGTRLYAGKFTGTDYGLIPEFRDGTQDYQTEVTFFNQYGYFDCALFGIAEGGSPVSTYSDSATGNGDYCNYSYGGSLYGNTLISEMGDPRTNNEQMYFRRVTGSAGDLSRYYNGNHTLGYPNANYVQPVGGTFTAPGASSSSAFLTWPDYYSWPDTTTYTNPTPANAPAVIADKPLASIGQLGDVYDPARINGSTIEMARGGGRTFKIGQRDDRTTYDPSGSTNSSLDNIPASQGWASWRLADVFSAGPVDTSNFTGPVQEPIELPARLNINGFLRDKGAALRTLLSNFKFQPSTVDPATGTSEPLFHTPPSLAGGQLLLLPTDPNGLSKIIAQMTARLAITTPNVGSNVPWGPFFERGELGELEIGGAPIFGKNVPSSFLKSTDLMGASVDMDHTFDRGREELVRRVSEMICTRGDTFTVYAVGQALTQPRTLPPPQRLAVPTGCA